jgi:hypothetical protein
LCWARNEIVVDDIMAKHTSGIGDSIGSLVVVHYVVDVLRVCLGERLAVVPAHPEIAVVGGLVAFDVCTELLANREGDDGVGNRNVGNTYAIDGIPLPICNRTMVQNDAVYQSISICSRFHITYFVAPPMLKALFPVAVSKLPCRIRKSIYSISSTRCVVARSNK